MVMSLQEALFCPFDGTKIKAVEIRDRKIFTKENKSYGWRVYCHVCERTLDIEDKELTLKVDRPS